MRRIVVGNWKMNMSPSEASVFVHHLEQKMGPHPDVDVVVCPPFVDLFPLAKDLDHKIARLGAQNIHPKDKGAHTGEISAPMLKGLVDYVIVGHSERRAMGETDKFIAQKVAAAVRNDLTPILCVGETLDEREQELTTKVVTDQVTACLADVTAPDISGVIIAYEPVWAIGSGIPATPEQIRPAIRAIRRTVEELYGAEASGLRIIYGGSTKADYVKDILAVGGIDGFLPGSASLNYDEFSRIISHTQEAA